MPGLDPAEQRSDRLLRSNGSSSMVTRNRSRVVRGRRIRVGARRTPTKRRAELTMDTLFQSDEEPATELGAGHAVRSCAS